MYTNIVVGSKNIYIYIGEINNINFFLRKIKVLHVIAENISHEFVNTRRLKNLYNN